LNGACKSFEFQIFSQPSIDSKFSIAISRGLLQNIRIETNLDKVAVAAVKAFSRIFGEALILIFKMFYFIVLLRFDEF
jgi:hypothetical protein